MSWVFGAIAATLGVISLWGLISPRSQWRVLASWSVADPHKHEPGGAAYGIRRALSAVGVLGIAVVLVGASSATLFAPPKKDPSPLPPVQVMWGAPTPRLIDRVIYPLAAAPEGLASQTVLGYQDLDDEEELPSYLLTLRPFTRLGVSDIPGYIGSDAPDGFSAIGTANFVVKVRGPILCIPRAAVAVETESTVQIAIYYGLPDPAPAADGSVAPVDHLAGCSPDARITGSVLIPIRLSAPIGAREVQALDGTPIERVRVVD